MRQGNNILRKIDKITVFLYVFLVMAGWLSIYASEHFSVDSLYIDFSKNHGKQLIWILTSIVLLTGILIIDVKFYGAFAYLIYFTTILLLIGVILLGKEIAGSKSWFEIAGFSLQPSEFAKFATGLALAKYLSRMDLDINKLATKITAAAIITFPGFLILLQHDTGSAVVFAAFVLVLFRSGLSGMLIVLGFSVMLVFTLTLLWGTLVVSAIVVVVGGAFLFFTRRYFKFRWLRYSAVLLVSFLFIFSVDYAFDTILKPHQKNRINVLLGKETDLHGAGYNVNQSMIAIGSGGFSGKGFLKGTQTKYNFVPEQSTDFIFCTVGEEWGFMGSLVIVFCFVGLTIRLVSLAERQRSKFAMLYGYGVAAIIFFHFAINIGMTIGLIPVIGIPLPFLSYGGSSLWGFTILLFIFVKMDSARLELL